MKHGTIPAMWHHLTNVMFKLGITSRGPQSLDAATATQAVGTGTTADPPGRLDPRPETTPAVPDSHRRNARHYVKARFHVAIAVLSSLPQSTVLKLAADVAQELVETAAHLATLVPIPGIQAAAETLLYIWQAVRTVYENREAYIRLVRRCGEMLMFLRDEITRAGIAAELIALPLQRLEGSFERIKLSLKEHSDRSAFVRCLRRRAMWEALKDHHVDLNDALSCFNSSVIIRIFETAVTSQRQDREDAATITAQQRRDTAITTALLTNGQQRRDGPAHLGGRRDSHENESRNVRDALRGEMDDHEILQEPRSIAMESTS